MNKCTWRAKHYMALAISSWEREQGPARLHLAGQAKIGILCSAPIFLAFLHLLTDRLQERGSEENPFLHLGLHLAVREQISIDRPAGIRDLQRQLQAHYGDAHRAEHALMESLGEELWTAQRDGRAPDERQYLILARNRLS